MAETPTVYVICDANCKFEGMTKEQIYAAILQAVNEGTIGDIDSGFVQTIKTINGKGLKFFVGTQAEYEELTDDDKENLFAIITNDTTREGITQAITDMQTDLTELLTGLANGDFVVINAARAKKIVTFVLNSYEDLLNILEEYGYYGTYAIAINEKEISLPNEAGTLPVWHSGIMVADTDVSLTLTGQNGDIVSAYYDGSAKIWSVQTLKQKPDEASHADSATYADNAAYASSAIVANSAKSATSATKDGNGKEIATSYGDFSNDWVYGSLLSPWKVTLSGEGVYLFVVSDSEGTFTFKTSCCAYFDGATETTILLSHDINFGDYDNYAIYRLKISTDGTTVVQLASQISGAKSNWFTQESGISIKYKKIWG